MKKIIVIIIALVCSYTLIGQTTTTAVLGTDTIYLPQIAQDGCFTVCDSGCNDSAANSIRLAIASFFKATAQPYCADTTISIKGVAYCGQLFSPIPSYYQQDGLCFQILGSDTATVLAKARYDTITNTYPPTFGATVHIFRAYFDTSITVNGRFFVSINTSNKIDREYGLGSITFSQGTCLTNNYPSPIIMFDTSSYWEQTKDSSNNFLLTNLFTNMDVLCIYPILGEKHNIDTTSSISQVDIKDAVTLYPNPASNKLYLASSFGINKIEVFNIMGQKLKEDEVNCSNYNLNISNFVKGNYIIKIITPRGTTEKKFIKE
jgi:hypothetical protein